MIRQLKTVTAALLALLLVAPPVSAQETTGAPASTSVASLRDALAADSSIGDEERTALSERLNGAARDLELAASAEAELRSLKETLAESAELIADYENRATDIRRAPATVQRRLGPNPDLAALEAEIGVIDGQRSDWVRQRKEALDATAAMAQKDGELRKLLAELGAPGGDARSAAVDAGAPIADQIAHFAARAAAKARTQRRELIELQLRGSPELNRIRSARVSWLDAAIAEADALLTALREAAAASRESAGEQRSAETRRIIDSLSDPSPALRQIADGNLEIINEFRELGRDIEARRQGLARKRQTIEDIQQDAQLTQRRLEVSGLGAALGDVMLSRLASLPNPATILADSRSRNARIADVSSAAIDSEQLLRRFSDRSAYDALLAGGALTPGEERAAERLLDQRRSLLQGNLQAQNTLLRLLVDENQTAQELATVTEDYQAMLTGNLLWVRNYNYARPEQLLAQVEVLLTMISRWQPLDRVSALTRDVPFVVGAVLLMAVALRRRATRRALQEMLGKPIRPRDESAARIFKGLFLTLVATLLGTLAFAVTARALIVLSGQNPAIQAIGSALLSAAVVLFALRFIGRLAGKLGVGRRLLKWNSPKSDLLLADLRWLRPLFAIAVFVSILGRTLAPTESGGPLAAIGSFAEALLLLLFMRHQLKAGVYQNDRILRYGLRAGVLMSLAIVVMHLSGQLFAAHLYLRALALTIAAILITLFIANVLQRCLIIYRMGLERKTREERKARETDQTTEGTDEAPTTETSDAMEAVTSLSEAYTQLLGLARLLSLGALLWLIWSPALPALTIFDSVVLWTTTDPSLPAGELREISLSVLLLTIVVIVITLLVTKHLPPLLNVLLLEWTRVTAGTRYAAGMLLQYLVIGVGLSSALAMLGFQWSKVQWLVAALGVGIGFGLQEIVANFISGLIVLFERPIRVGDIINASGLDGTVVNINPRATVIETFDGKEVMIPNKELITGTVTNWSLSSTRLRIVVPVGIAYGSDVEDAIARLKRIADAHPDVLADPVPFITFEDFGDNALILWLRCHALGEYLRVGTELRREIYRDFNAAGIGIAFPQRDVHLDASEPLPIRILREDDKS